MGDVNDVVDRRGAHWARCTNEVHRSVRPSENTSKDQIELVLNSGESLKNVMQRHRLSPS